MKFCNHDTSRLSTFRFTKIPKVLIILVVGFLQLQNLFSQHISLDNYKGYWEDAGTWNPVWASPSKSISGYNITINGYVTAEGSLNFFNLATQLIVNDTLVINGDFYLHNNNDLIINDQGILIVRGNFYFYEHSLITTNGYFIITGDIIKENDHHLGFFTSNDNPPKVFIGGSASPSLITNNFLGYPVLNCNNPVTTPYPYSGCSSGNMDDLKKDPIFPFFQSTCNFYVSRPKISVCRGDSIHLTATGGQNYNWSGPANFASNLQNPTLTDANTAMSGIYTVYITADHDCETTDTIDVFVNQKPAVSITSSDDILCLNSQRNLTGMPTGGIFLVENGPGSISQNILKASDVGEIKIKYLYSHVCSNTDSQTLIVQPQITVDITSSDDTLCLSEQRTLTGIPAGGTFLVEKGPGLLTDNILEATNKGRIYIKYIDENICSNIDSQIIVVNPPIDVSISSSDDILCLNSQRNLTGMPTGGIFLVEGPGSISENILKASDVGEIKIRYLYNHACSNTDSQTLIIQPQITVDITSSDDTLCLNEQRTLKGTPAGGSFVVKGPGSLTGDILKATDSGQIYIKYIYDNVCSNIDSQIIVVNPTVNVSISSSDDTLCIDDHRALTGLPSGGTFMIENGPGFLTGNILKALSVGEIVIKYMYNRMCANTDGQTIISSARAESDAGENQELRYVFETTLAANIHPSERGKWTLVSGRGNIQDINSPESKVTGLSLGENVFLWTVSNGACESGSEVTVTVLDLVIPSVFTPNDDGINDNFYIPDYNQLFELTILNQWGLIEYESHSFTDHWDGISNKGNQLPPETYFYILKFENGHTKKGTVLIVK